MKKLISAAAALIVLFSLTTVCLAGDIPESLLSSDTAQVFFGEVKAVDGERITVIQRQNVKGPFTQDTEITFQDFEFAESPPVGGQYLCGYYDENNPLYLWEVTSLDPKTLEIKNAGENSMSARMQAYLNGGEFEEKEQERLAALALLNPPSPSTGELPNTGEAAPGDQPPTPVRPAEQTTPVIVWAAAAAVLAGGAAFFLIRHRR